MKAGAMYAAPGVGLAEVAPAHEGGGLARELRAAAQQQHDVEQPHAPEGPDAEPQGRRPGPFGAPGIEGRQRKRGHDDTPLPGGTPERQGPSVGVVRGVRAPEGIRSGTKEILSPGEKGALFLPGEGTEG